MKINNLTHLYATWIMVALAVLLNSCSVTRQVEKGDHSVLKENTVTEGPQGIQKAIPLYPADTAEKDTATLGSTTVDSATSEISDSATSDSTSHSNSLPKTADSSTDTTSIHDTLALNPTPDLATIVAQGGKYIPQSSSFTDILEYKAKDSVYIDMRTRVAHLYSEAGVNYQGMKLEADYMEIHMPKSEVVALPTKDTTGMEVGIPHFQDKENSFDAKEIRYNFNSKRGLIRDVLTQQGEIYVHGNMVKKYENDVSFIKNARFTSCDLEVPHFDIRAFKAKVVPEKSIVMGSAMLFIENIPTPLVIPFALVPNQKDRTSGLIMPSFGQTQRAGFYLQGLGYYLNVSDYFDLGIEGDVYTSGNWEIRSALRYALRYKFSGSLNVGYSWIFQGERGLPNRPHNTGFKIQWSHSQDSKARPNSRFSANVNYTNSTYSDYSTDLNDYLTNTTSSNITYSLDFARKLHLSVNANADYNTYTQAFNISLPSLSLSVDQLYPFRRRNAVGKRRWYENISFNYNMVAQNQVNAYDTTLFDKETWLNMNNGMKHTAKLSSTVKIFKHINWSNNLNYNEFWYLKNTEQYYDTLTGQVGYLDRKGFKTTRQFDFNSNFYFNLYGLMKFRRGPLLALRHVITPNVGFTYRPDFSKPFWGAYASYTDPNGVEHIYSKYANSLYGGPASGTVGSINFSIKNSFQMKVKSKKDTVNPEKKVNLIDNLSISTSYNMAADSLRWAPLTINARTVLFQRLNISVGASFDFYKTDANGNRINEFYWVNNKKKGLRFSRTDLAASLGWNLNPKAKPQSNQEVSELPEDPYYPSDIYNPTDIFLQPIDFKAPWNLNIGYNLNYILTPNAQTGKMDHNLVQTMTLSGNVKFTDKFTMNFGTGFDLQTRKFTITTISFSRDLHCWEMGFYWVPFGYRTEWNFHIRVKSSIFQSLKYEKRKSFIDNYY